MYTFFLLIQNLYHLFLFPVKIQLITKNYQWRCSSSFLFLFLFFIFSCFDFFFLPFCSFFEAEFFFQFIQIIIRLWCISFFLFSFSSSSSSSLFSPDIWLPALGEVKKLQITSKEYQSFNREKKMMMRKRKISLLLSFILLATSLGMHFLSTSNS